MEEDDIDYKFAYEQHFGAISSESGSENEEEFLRLYGNYEPLPVPIDPNNVIIVPPDELFEQFDHQIDQKNAISSTGHIDEEGFIKVGVENMKSKKTARQSEFSNQSVAKDQKNRGKNISSQKKTSHKKLTKTHSPQSKKQNNKPPQTKFPVRSTYSNNISRPKEKKLSTNTYVPSLMVKEFDTSVINCVGTEKSTGAKKKKSKDKQNNVPFYTPFELIEDDFPALSSPTSNVSRPKKKMLPNECQIGPEINIPKDQEVSNTNQKYSAAFEALLTMERSDYYPIINTTTNPILLEMMSNTNNDAVKTENEVSYSVNCTPEYIRTESDLFMQKEMKSKNKDTTRDVGSFVFHNSKCSTTNIGTEKSTGAKKKKSKNKQNNVPCSIPCYTPFELIEDDFPALSSPTSNVSRPKKKMLEKILPNECQIGPEINTPKDQEVSNTNQKYSAAIEALLTMERSDYYPIINTTTNPILLEMMSNTNNDAVKTENEVSYSVNCTPEYIRTDSDLFVQKEMKSKKRYTTRDAGSFVFDNSKCSTTNIGTEKSTGAKRKKSKNKKNYVPITTTFKFKEDKFPALPSSTSNVNIPNQLQIGADINIPNDQEVLYTNIEYSTVAKFLEMEKISYPPPINTTTIPSITEMQFDKSNNAVNHQNEVPHFINYSTGNSTTDSDPFMQNQMQSKNKDTINGVDNSKCSTTNLRTEKSTGSKKKKSRNKKQKNVKTSNTVEENKIETLENTLQLNKIKKKAFTGYSSMHKIFQGSENVMTRRLMGLKHTRVIDYLDFLTLPRTSSNASVSVNSWQIPKNIVKTAKTELQLINNMMKETIFNNLNYYGSYSNLKTEECVASYTATECKTLENIPQFNDLQKVIVAGTAPIAHDNEIRQNIELTERNNQETNSIDNDKCFNAQVPKMFVKAAKTELQLVNNMMQDDSFNNLNYYGYYSNLKADEYFARYTATECKTSKNISHLNEMQNVVIADPSAFTNEYEISRCVGSNLTKDNKLETNSIDNYICFSDPQVSRNIAKTTETELQLVNNMMQDDSFNNLNYYGSYSNLKAEECIASYTARDCKTPENFLQLNEMQNVVMPENLQIGKPKFDVSQDNECVQKLHKRKLKFKNNPVLDAINYAHIELEDNIAKNNMPYKRDCDTNMSIEELTTKVNSAAIVNIKDVGVNTDDQLTSTNVNVSRKTCDVGVNTSKLVTGKNIGVNTDDELTSTNVNMSRRTCDVGVNTSKLVTGENVENTTQQQSFQTVDPNSNISILDIFDKFIKLTRCDNDMPASIQLALQLTIILLIINIFSSLVLWALDNIILICLIILYGIHFFNR